jgi:signal transduction histidine kinase
VNYQSKNIPREVPKETAIKIYRIAQEALRNISKHTEVTTVDIALLGDGETIHLTIKDDGPGIDPRGKNTKAGPGKYEERTPLIGGDLSTLYLPGNGAVIKVIAPLSVRTA